MAELPEDLQYVFDAVFVWYFSSKRFAKCFKRGPLTRTAETRADSQRQYIYTPAGSLTRTLSSATSVKTNKPKIYAKPFGPYLSLHQQSKYIRNISVDKKSTSVPRTHSHKACANLLNNGGGASELEVYCFNLNPVLPTDWPITLSFLENYDSGSGT